MLVQSRQRHVIEETRGSRDARKVANMVKLQLGVS